MCKAQKYITQLTDIMNDIEADYQQLIESVSTQDKIRSDILHEIENTDGKFDMYAGYLFAKALYNNSEQRRTVKNELENMATLRISTESHLKKLNNMSRQISGKEKRQNNPKYKPRVLKSPEDFQLIVGGMQ